MTAAQLHLRAALAVLGAVAMAQSQAQTQLLRQQI
jgi:hypothetical protein